jgi:hypothetical protein
MSLLQVTITTDGVLAATPAMRRNALRNAFAYLAGLWDSLYKMKRFEAGATRRYGLQPRKGEHGSGRKWAGSYVQAKVKRRKNGDGVQAIGENKPFVWSGATRSQVRSERNIVAKAASSSRAYAENIFNVPTLNLRPKKGGKINLRQEFQTVREDERKLLEDLGAAHYQNSFRNIPPKITRVA